MVKQQVVEFLKEQRPCPQCEKTRPLKGAHEIVYRTLFGKLQLESPRFDQCRFQAKGRLSFSPLAELLSERTAPERQYLETKFAAFLPFGVTAESLSEVLPLGQKVSTSVIRGNLQKVGLIPLRGHDRSSSRDFYRKSSGVVSSYRESIVLVNQWRDSG